VICDFQTNELTNQSISQSVYCVAGLRAGFNIQVMQLVATADQSCFNVSPV